MSIVRVIFDKLKSKFLKNTGWLLFEQIYYMGLSLLITSLVARYLGTHNYGLINYGLAFVSIFTTISQLGIGEILVHEIINNRKNTGKIIGTTIGLRIISSVFSIVLIFVLVMFLNPGEIVIQTITFIQSVSLIFLAFDTVKYWFQSNLESKYAVISKSIAFTCVSAWRLILILIKAPVQYFAFATVIEGLVISIFLLIFYFGFKGQRFLFSLKTAKDLLSKSYYFLISGIFVTIYTQLDKIILGQLTDESTVGIFAAAMTISGMWIFVPYSLIDSSRPVIMSLKNKNGELYKKRFKQLFAAIIWISLIASLLITLLSKPIIMILYGEQYITAVGVLNVLIWSKIFSLIGSARTIWLITEDLNKFQIIFLAIGAVTNVGLNLLLIPKFGAIGAAIGAIAAEFISNFIALMLFKDTRPLVKLIIEAFLFKGIKEETMK
ncbi:flippase [Caldifermentibacillus hisashii]|uniref:flippase n=1 Tax=Caldifermentibacillus hisashii TaxID=996558 RepID=UPI0031FD4DD4